MSVRLLNCVLVLLLATTGCILIFAQTSAHELHDLSLCAESRDWERAGVNRALKITPQIIEDENGRSYHFDLGGRNGLRYLDASCGFGAYAECNFEVASSNGRGFGFSEVSTFSLWERDRKFYLVYRVVAPKAESERGLRRVVKVDEPPVEICNQIGDYSNLM